MINLSVLFLAASLLVPSFASDSKLAAKTSKEGLPLNPQPLPLYLNPPQDSTPIHLLPPEILAKVLLPLPVQRLLFVCSEWRDAILKHFMPELRALFGVPWFEADFESEQARDCLLSHIIDRDCTEIVMQAREAESAPWGFTAHVRDKLRENRLVQMLPGLWSANSKSRLMDTLCGRGGFSKLPLAVRQFIAAERIWGVKTPVHPELGSLSSFLSSFHKEFTDFNHSLAHINFSVVETACFEITLGVNCAQLSVQDRATLLDSIKSLFSDNESLVMVCSLHTKLPLSPSVSQVAEAVSDNRSLEYALCSRLHSLPEYQLADWCMKELKRPSIRVSSPHCSSLQLSLLFSNAFLEKHGMSKEDRPALLKLCKTKYVFRSLPLNLTGLDIQALVEWLDTEIRHLRYLSQSDAARVTAVLDCFHKETLSEHATELSDDQKARVAKIASLLDAHGGRVVSQPPSDCLVAVKAWLDNPHECKMPQLDQQQQNTAARLLVEHIGDDPSKVDDLQELPEYCRAVALLLTRCDAVAKRLGETIEDGDVVDHYTTAHYSFRSVFESYEEVVMAARRAHECWQSCEQFRET